MTPNNLLNYAQLFLTEDEITLFINSIDDIEYFIENEDPNLSNFSKLSNYLQQLEIPLERNCNKFAKGIMEYFVELYKESKETASILAEYRRNATKQILDCAIKSGFSNEQAEELALKFYSNYEILPINSASLSQNKVHFKEGTFPKAPPVEFVQSVIKCIEEKNEDVVNIARNIFNLVFVVYRSLWSILTPEYLQLMTDRLFSEYTELSKLFGNEKSFEGVKNRFAKKN